MKTSRAFRGLLSLTLAAALFLFILPRMGRAEDRVWEPVTGLEGLASGQYVLVTEAGYGPGALREDWVTAVQPEIADGTVRDPKGAVWTLSVEDGGAVLTDSAGISIAPLPDGQNGITEGACRWTISCADGRFSFHSTSGGEAVTFAANRNADYLFRAYKDSAIAAGPDAYPCTFALYRLSDVPEASGPSEGTTLPDEEPGETVSAIAEALAAATGTENITIQGTVTLVDGAGVVLQDSTGGMFLTFDTPPEAKPGDVLKATGTRTEGGLAAAKYEITGTADLPAAEVTIGAFLSDPETVREYTRVLLRDAVLGADALTVGEASVPLAAPLPDGAAPGDTADVYALVLRDGGCRLWVTSLTNVRPAETEDRKVVWNSISPEDILPTDTIAVTMTKDGSTWALSSANGSATPPDAVEVTRKDNAMYSAAADGLGWNILRGKAGYQLFAADASETWLYTLDKNNSVRVGTAGDGLWTIEDGYLKHLDTGRYLSVYQGTLWRALTNHKSQDASGQTVAFWRLEPPAPPETVEAVAIDPDGGELTAGDPITLSCATEGAAIFYATSSDGENYTEYTAYTQPITPDPGFGTLYVKACAAKEGCLDSPETLRVFTEPITTKWNFYFGQLHAHTNLSDGAGSVEEAFAHAANVEGLDFFAVTDHSDSFDNARSGAIGQDGSTLSAEWAAGKAAAEAVTNEDFVGIFGYEMSWQEGKKLGHINTFNTPGWQSADQEAYSSQPTALESYYKTLTTVPGSISQFNHPSPSFGYFEGFAHYSAEYDQVITLLEVGSEEGFGGCKYYNQALNAGWHVAPTNNQNNHRGSWGDASAARTVVLAESLTEERLFDAMRNYRVYATEDSDLTVLYELSGNGMGAILSGPVDPEISVSLWDPTDTGVCKVQVIADGNTVATFQAAYGEPALCSAPKGCSYYYLYIEQADGDVAVTAPVWVDTLADMGIRSLTADTSVPVQNEELRLTAELFNDEKTDLVLNSLTLLVDGEEVQTVQSPGTVPAMGSLSHIFSYTHPGMGVTKFEVVANAAVNGETRTYRQTLTLRYRVPELVTRILVCGSGSLDYLTELAQGVHIGVSEFSGTFDGNLLLVLPPKEPFGDAFLTAAADFVRCGGSVILCGQSDAGDGDIHTAGELNRLLAAIGSTLRFHDDTAIDRENNGGFPDILFCTEYNTESGWCKGITGENLYGQHSGCTVDPGDGVWLVKGFASAGSIDADADGTGGGDSAILLACEEMEGGGTVFVSGSPFLTDTEMPRPRNVWDPISANEFFLNKLLHIERMQWPLSTIADVRSGEAGQVYRIRGYATSGTSHPGNIFPETIYVQDDTGGIAVIPFTDSGIQVGAPLEVIGYLSSRQGNPVLELIGYEVLEEDFYRYVPKTVLHDEAMDYETNGGRLMQVEGTAVGLTREGQSVSRIRLTDRKGRVAEVMIEEAIVSGSKGVNDLASQVKLGRTVRAIGILHLDEDGNPVLRVRNCDEVVYVPPVEVPYTGDAVGVWLVLMVASGGGLTLLLLRKRRK